MPIEARTLRHTSPDLPRRVAGLGAANARSAAQSLVDLGCEVLISWGTACALSDALVAGDLIVGAKVVGGGRSWAADGDWCRTTVARLAGTDGAFGLHVGAVTAVEQVLARAADKQAARLDTGCLIADMESAAIAEVASRAGLGFGVVRAVVDGPEKPLPAAVLGSLRDDGRFRYARFARLLCRRPHEIGAVAQLARQYRSARRSLELAARALFVLN